MLVLPVNLLVTDNSHIVYNQIAVLTVSVLLKKNPFMFVTSGGEWRLYYDIGLWGCKENLGLQTSVWTHLS